MPKMYLIKKFIILGFIFHLSFFNNIFANNKFEIDTSKNSNFLNDYINKIPENNFYILGSGDVLDIRVGEGTDALNKIVPIDGEGIITLKRLNRVYVEGLTIEELIKVLSKSYSEYVNDVDVSISVLQYRTVTVYIDGEVETPGLHSFLSLKTDPLLSQRYKVSPNLINALRLSDGITTNADLSNIEVTRINSLSNGGGRIKAKINLLDALNLKDNAQNIRLYDGDTIKVGKSQNPVFSQISKAMQSNINPKYISVFVGGRVQKEGKFQVGKTAVLTDAIDIAGGAKIMKGPVNFLRVNPDGTVDKRKFRFKNNSKRGSYKNPYLKNGDMIFIANSLFSRSSEVLTELTSPFSSFINSYAIYKAFDSL
ncbi:polysaccharide biosynthesis/export family protein [Acinetobacter sp.]|uniref:polysaccharide biosynthesis/export family protein n=1 Tax=Acinetobacter sp. TaxID=472 RepID=UPI000C589504|nr:polysaccharide biosynthesis/export family protein [Acinetobacter sp.]MBC69631.1 hypothetical protein [Acinetobacter sp.]